MAESFVLGVDLDGVCAEHTIGFRKIVAERLGVDEATLPLERGWDFAEWGFEPGDFEDHHRHAVVEKRMFRDLDPIDGAAETLWRLSDAGVWIRIITHRLYVNWGHHAAVADTCEWLDKARIPYRDLCFLGTKPAVEADLYIDDSPHNIAALRKAGNEVIVFDQPYNQDQRGPRATTWADVEEIVLERFTERQGIHGVQPQLPGVDGALGRRLGND
ncbi:MAG: 5'-nucleotidase [Candidatus Aldehydirespiratoraceae bacterium]